MKNEDKSHKVRSNCEQVRNKYEHKVRILDLIESFVLDLNVTKTNHVTL